MTAGQTYKIRVGGGGKTASNSVGYAGGFGGGGLCGKTNRAGDAYKTGSGGGLTGLFINSVAHSNSRIIAGGGAGAPGGGAGGGSSGSNGPSYGSASGGKGGTQTAGGARGTIGTSPYSGVSNLAGSALAGGRGANGTGTNWSGGGGGGGYYGGGGGAANNYRGAPGGGGSGYLSGTSIVFADRINSLGTKGANLTKNAPYSNDVDYINNAGKATSFSTGVSQPNGLAVFRPIL